MAVNHPPHHYRTKLGKDGRMYKVLKKQYRVNQSSRKVKPGSYNCDQKRKSACKAAAACTYKKDRGCRKKRLR